MENGEYQKKVIDSLARLETNMKGVCKKQDDHEKRLRFLERGIWVAFGMLVVADILVNTLVK